jgi:hypothetical protein
MRKNFSISRKQSTIFIILVALLSAGLWYYLNYIPNKEQELDQQHFRWLQNTDNNIRAKIVGFDTLLSNFLNAYITNKNKDSVKNYISAYTIQNVIFSVYEKPDTDKGYTPTQYKIDTAITDTNAVVFALSWDSVSNKLTFKVSKKEPKRHLQYNVAMTTDFEEFIKPLLIPGLFEHYVVFDNGKYIYEDFHSGLGYNFKNEDSLLATGKNLTGANILQQKVGGIDYQIFMQPINFFSNGRLIIAGLISRKTMDAEKKQLPTGVVIFAIIIALGILLFLPWIKIYFQGKYDKITLRDAAASAVVAKLLISLVVLLCFTYNMPFKHDTEEDSKNFLADTIANSFKKEINSAFNCLQYFDTLAYNHRMLYNVKKIGEDHFYKQTGSDIFSEKYDKVDTIRLNNCPISYTEVNWLDSTGFLKYGWTKASYNNIPANYSYRPYFKNLIDSNTITLSIGPDVPVVLDQIVSTTSGAFRTVISKPSVLNTLKDPNTARVVTLSFNMKSLDSVIMPAGYSFAIIDDKGDVKYHSKTERNLNENLKDEFTNNEALKDALTGRFTEEFITDYYEGTYSVLVKPIKDLPYFIVIMDDQSFDGSVQIETFSFTWGMILVFLLVVMIDLSIVIVASSRRSLFKKQYFVTSWVWPRKSSANEYRIATIANIILIVVLICMPLLLPPFYDYLSYLFILFFSIPISTFFMNTLFLYKYKREKNDAYVNYKVNCNKGSLGFLAVLNLFALISLAGIYLHILLFEILVAGALYIFFRQYKKRDSTVNNDKNNNESSDKNNKFVRHYVWMIFTRLLITSAIPAVFFFIASYNFENNLMARYRKYDFSQQLKQKFARKSYDAKKFNAVYPDSIWIKSIESGKHRLQSDALTTAQNNTAALFNAFGFYLADVDTVNNDNFYKNYSDDSSLYFNNFFDSVLYRKHKDRLYVNNEISKSPTPGFTENDSTTNQIVISSENLNYTPPGFAYHGFMFWLFLLLVLIGFYFILAEVIKKVCSLNLTSITLLKNVRIISDDLIAKKDEKLLWIVGLPVDETVEQVKAKMKDAGVIPALSFNNIIISDNKRNDWEVMKSAALLNDHEFILLLDIENNLDDEAVTKEKLHCIKQLLDKGKKLRIVSAMHPLKMLEIINHPKNDNATITDTIAARLMYLTFENAAVVILPLIENDFKDVTKTQITPVDLFLEKELKYTQFLKNLYAESLLSEEDKKVTKFREDKLTLRIQFLANNFYMSIWHSLSSDEKFILYDLAADGLVNITNTAAMSLLVSKGLIVDEEGTLHIFARSFRNFILTAVESKELTRLQMLHNKHSNWSKLQTPLLIVVLVVLAFLAIAQEGLYSRVIAIITSVAAGIPAIVQIFTIFAAASSRDIKNTSQQ